MNNSTAQNQNTTAKLIRKMAAMSESQLFHALYTDTLTRILNRRALEEITTPIIAIIDLDSLKYVNDNHGHRMGDKMLRGLADTLTSVFGSDNTYRISGDEFAVTGTSQQTLDNGMHQARAMFPGFSYGIGSTFKSADDQLLREKSVREITGQRAPRGEMPPWVDIIHQQEAA